MKKAFAEKMKQIAEEIEKAHTEHRKRELKMKACPKCQFEAVENDKCLHCGYQL